MLQQKLVLSIGLASTVIGCVAPADDDVYASDGKEDGSWPELKAGPITYKRFVTAVLRLPSLSPGKSYYYLGQHNGVPCKLGMWYSGSQGSYSDMFFDVRENPMDEDSVSG